MPPKTRLEQMHRFNSTNSLLVATDCIGLGMNLKIKKILFVSLMKFDGNSRRILTSHEIRQVAGRAGRFLQTSTGDAHVLIKHEDFVKPLSEAFEVTKKIEQANFRQLDEETSSFIRYFGN